MLLGNSLSIIIIIVFLLLIIITLFRRLKSKPHVLFAGFIFSSLIWALTNYFVDVSTNEKNILVWSQLTLVGPSLMPIFLLFFTYYFPEKIKIGKLQLIYALAFCLLIFFLIPTPLNIASVKKAEGMLPTVNTGPLYLVFAVYFFSSMFLAVRNLIHRYKRSFGVTQLQVKYIIIGVTVSVTFSLVTNLVLLLVGNSHYANLGPYSSLFFIICTVYAMARYRLMNIRLILAKSFLYFLLISVVASIMTFTAFGVGDLFVDLNRYARMAVYFAVSLIIVLILDPLKRILAKVTDDIFYKEKIDYQKVLRDLSIIIAREIDLDILLSALRRAMMSDLKLKAADILVQRKQEYVSLTIPGKKQELESPIIEYMQVKKDIVITDELHRMTYDLPDGPEHHRLRTVLDELERGGIEFCAPIFLEGDLKAVIILGAKQSGDIYTLDEVRFFNTLAPQIAVAIEKSQLYESIGEFNIQLQEKVNRATKKLKEYNTQLQDANAYLKQLDKAKSEFLSIASHQLRTPISAIKGYLSMLIEGDFGKLDPKQEKIIRDLFESAARLARLINIFLNVSRIESGRFKLDRAETDISMLVESVTKELQGQADSKSLHLSFDKLKQKVLLYIDSDKVREVILNLVDNAIKYTKEGSIVMRTFIDKGSYHFVVKDTGLGIHKEDAPVLFRKFVRGTGISQVNTQGSGLGLYIAQRVVAEHGGKIWAESEGYGKGSEFHFTLPMRENQKENFPAAKNETQEPKTSVREKIATPS